MSTPANPIYGNDTTASFASKVRAKFPDAKAADGRAYSQIPDDELAHSVIQKHPQYQNWLSTPEMERLTKQSFSAAPAVNQNLSDLAGGMTGTKTGSVGDVVGKVKNAGQYLLHNSPDQWASDAIDKVNDAGNDQLRAINSVPPGPAQGARKLLAAVPGIGPTAERLTEKPNFRDAGALVGAGLAAKAPALPAAARGIADSTLPARQALAQKIVQPLVYEGVGEAGADARMGIHPDRALIDEGIWGTKKSMSKQLGQRVGELKPAANELLNNAPGSRQWLDSSQSINSAIDDAIQTAKKDGVTDFTRLENLRKSLLTEHGPTSGNPLSQNDLKTSIQGTAKRLRAYANAVPAEASAGNAAADAARNVKNDVNSNVPEAAPMNNRMANAMDAQDGMNRSILADKGKDLFAHGTLNKLAQRTVGAPLVRSGAARFISLGSKLDVPSMPPTIGPGPQLPSPAGPPAAQAWTPQMPPPPVPAGPGLPVNPANAAEGPPLWNPAVGDFHPNSMWKTGNATVAPPTPPTIPSNGAGATPPSAPPAAPNVSAHSSASASPVLPPVPASPINPQEVADYSRLLGRPVTANEIPAIRARLDAERNISSGIAGNRSDQVGNIREAHRATLARPKDQKR